MLDFRYVRIIQSQSCAEFAVGIWTWSAWSNRILPTFNTSVPSLLVGPNRFTMLLDVNGDRKPDFVGDIVRPGVMELIDERRREIFDEPLGMERPTAFHASFFVSGPGLFDFLYPRGWAGTRTLGIALTSVNGSHRDRIPDHGWIRVVFQC